MIGEPGKKYKIVYADPPWSYDKYGWDRSSEKARLLSKKITGLAKTQYDTMSIDDICNLPVREITDQDCFLFMWTTWPIIKDSFRVMEAWGFDYRTIGFIWIKTNPNDAKPVFGLGSYTKSNSEPCLLGIKGQCMKYIKSQKVSSVVISSRRNHSKKPNEVRSRILKLCGDIPRIELFARTKIHGWDVFGNDDKLNLKPLEAFT